MTDSFSATILRPASARLGHQESLATGGFLGSHRGVPHACVVSHEDLAATGPTTSHRPIQHHARTRDAAKGKNHSQGMLRGSDLAHRRQPDNCSARETQQVAKPTATSTDDPTRRYAGSMETGLPSRR